MFNLFKKHSAPIVSGVSDRLLVAKVKKGDKEAFGKLYMKYLDSIYRYIYFKVGQDKFEAEDLTETVFFKAWDKVKEKNFKNDNFRAFVYTIARNQVIDFYRLSPKTTELNENIADKNISPEENVIRKWETKQVSEALNKLSAEQQEVIIMKFLDNMKTDEISEVLGKTNEAVRALQYRAFKQLKLLLAGQK